MFYGGIGIFCLAAILLIVSPILGIALSFVSIFVEIKAIQLGVKAYGKTKVGTLGNVFAGCWIALQILATAFFGMMMLRGFP